jgi:SAM-dependent methyltransferase
MKTESSTYPWRRDLRRRVVFPWGRKYEHPEGRGAFVATALESFLVGRVLDVGAGRNSATLREKLGAVYEALDLERPYQIKPEYPGKVSNTVVDLEQGQLPFSDGQYDTVICTDVLEHVDRIYEIYDELFRVAGRHVIISLPNNWVNFLGSFLAGRNVTHMAGYGLPPQPKRPGERHKYLFNFEEACDFLVGRTPRDFRVCYFDQRFEYGIDGVFCALPPVSMLFRGVGVRKLLAKSREKYGAIKGMALAALALPLYYPLRVLDVLLGAMIWGWGGRARYYNLFCRQIWVVYERVD